MCAFSSVGAGAAAGRAAVCAWAIGSLGAGAAAGCCRVALRSAAAGRCPQMFFCYLVSIYLQIYIYIYMCVYVFCFLSGGGEGS